MRKTNTGLFFALTFLAACATAPVPVPTRYDISHSKEGVFNAALLTLQEWGEDILTVDKSGGLLVTKPRDWGITENLTLNYRLTIIVKKKDANVTEYRIKLNGSKVIPSTGEWFGVDETDTDVRAIVEGISGGIQAKVAEE